MQNLTIITLNEPPIEDYALARNRLLSRVKTKWALFVDRDETITPALKAEIEMAIKSSKFAGYYLRRIDTFLGKELRYGETAHARFLRLARKNSGQWVRPVHEIWAVKGRVGELKNPLLHTPHPTVSSFLSKIDHYSTLEATYRHQQNKSPTLFRLVFSPLGKFIYNYCWLQGLRDGMPGIIMGLMMSFHSFLTWTKLYLLLNKR